MIGRLTGTVIEKNAPGSIILDVGGVGFEVFVPTPLIPLLPAAPTKVTLFTYLMVREDSVALYGFPSKVHLAVFKLLLQVKNVGPKLALSILSEMKPEEVGMALQKEESEKFKRVPGIGKKTAEMIIVELRDKIRSMTLALPVESLPVGGPLPEVASALLHLGFKPAEVQKTVEEMKDLAAAGASIEQLIKEALARLMG